MNSFASTISLGLDDSRANQAMGFHDTIAGMTAETGSASESCRLQVAALPWREAGEDVEIMLITSRDTGRWVLPKGWPEKSEELYEAAAREASEEAGIEGGIAHDDAGSYYYDKVRDVGDDQRCEVRVFPLHVERIAAKWRERRQRRRKWVTPRQAARMVNEPDLAKLLMQFRPHADKLQGAKSVA